MLAVGLIFFIKKSDFLYRNRQKKNIFPSPVLAVQVQWVEVDFLPLSPNNELPFKCYNNLERKFCQDMKRAVIFLNGDLSDLSQVKNYLKPDDFIICTDGGARHALEFNLKPNALIGDFDSLSSDLQKKFQNKNIEWLKFNIEKDESDSELTFNYIIEKGFAAVLIFGSFGTRLDHLLSNIFFLPKLAEKNIDVTIIEGKKEIKIVKDFIELKGEIGDLVSLIPLQTDAKKITTTGLQYKLTNEDLLFGYSRGISNIMQEKAASITFKSGTLLIIHERQ